MKPFSFLRGCLVLLILPVLGLAADDEIAGLVEKLSQKQDESARLNATLALGKLGKDAVKPVSAALVSDDADTRYYAVWALGLIGPDAKDKTGEVIKLLGDKNEQVRRKAAFALGRIAPASAALPELIKALGDDNPDVLAAAGTAAAGYGKEAVAPLVAALKSPQAKVRNHAATSLGKIGPDAIDALPALTALLADDDKFVVLAATQSLAKLGKESVPVLSEAIKSDKPDVRLPAVEALASVNGTEAINALVDALKSPQADVRRTAARVLGPMRISDKLVILSLAEVLKADKDQQARVEAIRALQQLGNAAKPALATVAQALADDDRNVSGQAFYLLQTMGADPVKSMQEHLKGADVRLRINVATMALHQLNNNHPEALAILTDALKEKEAEHRYRAAISLAQVRKAPGEAVALLVEALKDGKADLRVQAATGLGQVGQPAAKASAALIAAFKDGDANVRRQAAWAVGQVGDEASTVVPALAELLADADANVRSTAVTAMSRFARSALPHLKEAIKDKDANVRRTAASVLGNSGDPKEALPVLTEAFKDSDVGVRQQIMYAIYRFKDEAGPLYLEGLKDKEAQVRWTAANYLGQMPAFGKKALPAMAELAKADPDPTVRYYAVSSLTNMGEEAIPALAELTKVKDGNIHQTAMYGLQRHGAKAKPAVPALIEVLKSGEGNARWLAAQTLGAIGPDAREALEVLREAAKDPNPTLKAQATQAIARIEKK